MKTKPQSLVFVGFILLITGSLGCATKSGLDYVKEFDSDFYNIPVLVDEIIAIGRLDASLTKELEQDHVVVFIGQKNSYMLYKGGEELELVSKLKLDGTRMNIDAARKQSLYKEDQQVWGNFILDYGRGTPVSDEDQIELKKAGFTTRKEFGTIFFEKKVSVEGVIYPATKLSDVQMSKLSKHHYIKLYNAKDSKPPVIGKMSRVPAILAGVATDIVLFPLYAVGTLFGVILFSGQLEGSGK